MPTLEITYCVQWSYLPRATRLAAEIREAKGLEATLVKGRGGEFEVVYEGRLIFSKKQQGRFPETREVLEQIPA